MDFNKKIALIAAGSLLSVGGLYAMGTSANAATPVAPTAPAITSPVAGAEVQEATDADNVQEGDQNASDDATESAAESADDATESATESESDGPDQGLDMNASEAGHQDAPGADDATEVAEVAGK